MAWIKRAARQRKRSVEAQRTVESARTALASERQKATLIADKLGMSLEVMECGFDLVIDDDGAFLTQAQADKLRVWLNWWAEEVIGDEE